MFGIGLGKKKVGKVGYFVVIEFSEHAKNRAVGNDFLKKIYHVNGNYVFDVENYSVEKERSLRKNGVIIIDRTVGQLIPRESRYVPESKELLTRLQIKKVIGD